MTLLEKIDFLMKKNNLNKRQLSIQSGIPYSTIDNIWKRNTDSMRLPTFGKLCKFFGVSMESMAYDENEIVYLPAPAADGSSSTGSASEGSLSASPISREAEVIARAYDRAEDDMKASAAKLLDVKRAKMENSMASSRVS